MFEEVVSKVMRMVTDGLRETNKMYLELEQKRMEHEAQQKREEHQFQLQLVQLLVGQSSSPPYPPNARDIPLNFVVLSQLCNHHIIQILMKPTTSNCYSTCTRNIVSAR